MADIDMPETQPAAETQFAETQFETQPTPLGQLRLSDEEWLELVCWSVGNQHLYCETPRQQFWDELKLYFLEMFTRDLKNPDWVLNCLARIHRQKQAQLLRDSGKAESETDLDQALDQWVQILDDISENRRQAREEAAASEENDWTIAHSMQDHMMEHMRNKRRLGDASPDPESMPELTGQEDNSQSLLPDSQSPVPHNSCACQQSPLSPEKHTELLQKGMESVLTPLAAAIQSLTAARGTGSEPQQNENLHTDMASLREEMNVKMSAIMSILQELCRGVS
ncbi:hypothetical protein AJ80_08997 [Polytolypa hystricis UAMH7299]|uniref:Uncharacterized protein n=1 Tax=Polytolypa hystricis (strain UAMH7299) TaxID=1447883 RepID=A0A2B7WYJ0_POLH7|nr:hypothetical protein AJ80_08997 [Polytolypa hystricis UAMH7299]